VPGRSDTRRQFGEGPLSRAAALVYSLLVVEFLLLVTAAPGLIGLFLLRRDASNLPLAAICAVPLGPAMSAALYALHHHRADLTDLRPAGAFWRGYRANLRGVLLLWCPLLAWLTVLAVNLAHLSTAAVPRWWAGPLLAVAVAAVLWGVDALVITSLFAFRARDVARLALHFLGAARGVTLANACLLVVAVGLTVYGSEAVLALLGSVLALLLVRTSQPMITKVRREFTARAGAVNRRAPSACRPPPRCPSAGTTTPSSGPRRCGNPTTGCSTPPASTR
jgi:uncharacterized membrane protein YesL